jgi:hypothetical protein
LWRIYCSLNGLPLDCCQQLYWLIASLIKNVNQSHLIIWMVNGINQFVPKSGLNKMPKSTTHVFFFIILSFVAYIILLNMKEHLFLEIHPIICEDHPSWNHTQWINKYKSATYDIRLVVILLLLPFPIFVKDVFHLRIFQSIICITLRWNHRINHININHESWDNGVKHSY